MATRPTSSTPGLAGSIGGRIRSGAGKLRPLFNRRRRGRTSSERLVGCNLGLVLDLSPDGVRIRSTRRLRGRHRLELWTVGDRLRLRAEVRWSRRAGLRRFDSGLEFTDLAPETAARLATIMRAG